MSSLIDKKTLLTTIDHLYREVELLRQLVPRGTEGFHIPGKELLCVYHKAVPQKWAAHWSLFKKVGAFLQPLVDDSGKSLDFYSAEALMAFVLDYEPPRTDDDRDDPDIHGH